MNKLWQYIPFLIIFLPLISCSKDENIETKTTVAKIELSEVIIDEEYNISYQVPKLWDEMPASLSEKMVGRIRKHGVDEFITYTPKSFFYETKNNSLLRIGEIKFKNNFSSDSLSIENYSSMFQKYNRDLEIEITDITNCIFPIQQMKITKNNLISFKYLFRNHQNEIIQFDFSIKNKNINKFKSSIDASVNSINLL